MSREPVLRVLRALGLSVCLACIQLACDRVPEAPSPDPDTQGMEPRVAKRFVEAREAVVAEPREASAWGRLGRVADAHQLDEEAIACYRQAHALDPEDARWPYFLARLLSFKGVELEPARELFQTVLELRPSYAPAHYRLGDTELRLGNLEAAADHFRQALELDKSFARAHLALGQALLRQGDAEAALRSLERAHELVPEDATALFALAQAYRRTGDPERAAEAAREASQRQLLDTFPDPMLQEVSNEAISSTVLAERALAFLGAGRYREALKDLKIVEELRPEDANVQRDMGKAYQGLAKPDRAAEHYRRALELKDDLVEARALLGMLALETGNHHEAIAQLTRAGREAPADPGIAAGLAAAHARQGNLETADQTFERAAALGPLDAAALNEWGMVLAQTARFPDAAQKFQTALDLEPENAQILVNLGLTAEALGQRDRAIGFYRRAMQIDPNPMAANRLQALGAG